MNISAPKNRNQMFTNNINVAAFNYVMDKYSSFMILAKSKHLCVPFIIKGFNLQSWSSFSGRQEFESKPVGRRRIPQTNTSKNIADELKARFKVAKAFSAEKRCPIFRIGRLLTRALTASRSIRRAEVTAWKLNFSALICICINIVVQ